MPPIAEPPTARFHQMMLKPVKPRHRRQRADDHHPPRAAEQLEIAVDLVADRDGVEDEVEARRRRRICSGSVEMMTSSAPSLRASSPLLGRGGDHGDVRAHRRAELDAHVAKPAEADDRHLGAGADAILAERRVGRDPGAQQGRDAARVHAVGHLADEMVAHDDMVGVAALGDRAVVIVGAVVGLDAALAAEDFPAFEALVARHAAVDHAADRDRVADLVAVTSSPTAVTLPTISWPGITG